LDAVLLFPFTSFCLRFLPKRTTRLSRQQEYAEHLYENPRGIGCNKCHGKRGEGSVIARYKEKGELKELKTDEINSIGFDAFKLALQERHGVMPKYFLTSQEIKALYSYLHKDK